MQPKLVVITGPTASGKTALGVALAQRLGGEVVSADSMQIYRGMDIGTAKPTPEEMQGVPHHMIDIADPTENYSVSRYAKEAAACVDDILARGKLPIVVGGTGLYIDSLIAGRTFADGTADTALRQELSERYDEIGGEGLLGELRKVDPERAAKLHPADKKRIVRAMEVYILTGRTITQHDAETRTVPPRYDAAKIALDFADRQDLYDRIDRRVELMVRQGLFGEVVHCQGGYRHDLREEVSTGREMRHYRFRNYLYRNCENYPTHELGPIANVLDINRGNRMLTLVSVASKAAGLHEYLLREKGPDYDAAKMNFAQGDVVTTIIKCARGETICLTLDTTLPRAYSRGFHVQGTKGMYMEDNKSVFLDGKDNEYDFKWNERWNSAEEYREKYDHPVWKKYLAEGVRGGHDGMDWLVFRSFFDAAKAGAPAPIDVYDAAAWMSISCLSEQSVAMGGAPVAIPDFTNGKWMERAPWQP